MTARPAEKVTPELLQRWPLPRGGESKRDRGDVLIVGGSRKSPGAVLLAGRAALRSGAGRLTLAVAESVASSAAVTFPEAGVIGLPESRSGELGADSAKSLQDELQSCDALLLGPGLHSADEATRLLKEVLPRVPETAMVVLDAYALGVLPTLSSLAADLSGRLVLTPNKQEALRLLEKSDSDDPNDSDIDAVAERYGAVVSCFDRISDWRGSAWTVSEGGFGLGTSGSGDVLAGSVAGLLARGLDPAAAACWGTWVHSRAGDRLSARVSDAGFLATEIADELPHAFGDASTA
jgi:ADP-dependent NAD(P)H-hydrate dehydratase